MSLNAPRPAGLAAGCYPILVGNFVGNFDGAIACVADLSEAIQLIRTRADFARSSE
jgi:hypothetical protein